MTVYAKGSQVRAAVIAEVTPGTTPASPAFQVFRRLSGNMRPRKGIEVSEEVNLDRNQRTADLVSVDAEAEYQFQLSYGMLDAPILQSAMRSDWSTNVISIGSTPKAMTWEEASDIGGSNLFSRMVGAEVDQLSLDFVARQTVKGSVKLMGKSMSLGAAILSGATYVAANTNQVEVGANFASLTLHGLSPTPRIRRINLQISNGLMVNDGLGDLYTDEFSSGQAVVTGTIEALVASNTFEQKILDHSLGQIQFTVGSVTTKKYTFNMPTAQAMDGGKVIGGSRDLQIVSFPFQALGTAAAPALTITRAVA